MSVLLKRAWILATLAIILACQRTPADQSRQPGAAVDTVALVGDLAGCYELRSATQHLVVRLLTSRSGPGWWGAHDMRGENTGGNSWTWAPLDSNHLEIQWGGIDGARSYVVHRRRDDLVGEETVYSGNRGGSATRQPVQVRQIGCPPSTG